MKPHFLHVHYFLLYRISTRWHQEKLCNRRRGRFGILELPSIVKTYLEGTVSKHYCHQKKRSPHYKEHKH